jgi:SAM-dependent methyltransferase
MPDQEKLRMAAAFGAVPEMLPYIPELLADMWSLGIPPENIVELLKDQDLKPGTTRVLDLGCGKGANSITLARQFGFQTHGIDLFEPFIEEARQRAQELGVEDVCQFEQGDIKQTITVLKDYDMVLLIWVSGVLGGVAQSIHRIRQVIHPGGLMVIGEGYLKKGVSSDHPLLECFDRHEALLEKLTMHGDLLVRELVIPADRIHRFYREYLNSLRKGARKCADDFPEHAGILWDYVNSNDQMCKVMESSVESCLWLMRKNSSQTIPGSSL